ncbi:MAG: hypothetical protein ABL895_14790 [Cyclobacteriaceae bacterium]
MKWEKLGKIFDPTKYKLANNCFEFAQSPQTLVFDTFVRIYFSTREKDKTGKYLSHVSFIEMDKKFKKVFNVSTNTIIKLGGLGCFDEHGIFPINVLRDNDRILAYTSGWNRKVSVSVDASIGLAISYDDGLTFQKVGTGPVLTSSLHEPFLVGDGFVVKYGTSYHMWYVYGSRWIKDSTERDPQRVYKIVHAISNDGVSWERDGKHIILDKLNEDECQALPSVIHFNNRFHMVFCYRHAIGFRKIKDNGYRLGYAYSDDLIQWIRDDEKLGIDLTEGSWDSDMMCYPHIFRCDDKIYLLYNGNEFGRYGFGLAVLEEELV